MVLVLHLHLILMTMLSCCRSNARRRRRRRDTAVALKDYKDIGIMYVTQGSKREQARRRKNNKSLQCRQASILGSKRRRKNNKSLVTNEKGGAWLALAAKLLQHTLHLPQYNLINQSNNECNMSLWSVYTIQCDNSIVVGCVAVHCQTSLSNGTHSRWPG